MGNLYRFVEPVVLYLLARNSEAYGYELAGEFRRFALTDAEVDRPALYRTLRQLEEAGHVTSTWDTSGAGPARHTYQITESGRRHLAEWSEVLGNLVRSMQDFLQHVHALPSAGEIRNAAPADSQAVARQNHG
jgi:DNA-binding PadR family transcriptional regulator